VARALRARGLVLAAEGELERAEALLERAVEASKPVGMALQHGRTLLALGTVQRRSRRKRAARATLTRARSVFDGIGARIWAERARRELGRIGGRSAPAGRLSATEAGIVELVAAGLSNKEVARTLHLSPKTVEWNLSKVYRKLGVRSRTELVATRSAPD
jgi:DNA-binding NarL/FixJ family response regulator